MVLSFIATPTFRFTKGEHLKIRNSIKFIIEYTYFYSVAGQTERHMLNSANTDSYYSGVATGLKILPGCPFNEDGVVGDSSQFSQMYAGSLGRKLSTALSFPWTPLTQPLGEGEDLASSAHSTQHPGNSCPCHEYPRVAGLQTNLRQAVW